MTARSPFGRGYGQVAGPPPVAIGITLEYDGWWLYCPECDEARGPYGERGLAATARGRHLVARHGAENFAAGGHHAGRAVRATARRQRGETRW